MQMSSTDIILREIAGFMQNSDHRVFLSIFDSIDKILKYKVEELEREKRIYEADREYRKKHPYM